MKKNKEIRKNFCYRIGRSSYSVTKLGSVGEFMHGVLMFEGMLYNIKKISPQLAAVG